MLLLKFYVVFVKPLLSPLLLQALIKSKGKKNPPRFNEGDNKIKLLMQPA